MAGGEVAGMQGTDGLQPEQQHVSRVAGGLGARRERRVTGQARYKGNTRIDAIVLCMHGFVSGGFVERS